MMRLELIRRAGIETFGRMSDAARLGRLVRTGPLALGSAMIAGCVNVTAPDKPIVIELNVNVRQEVIYRLAAEAENVIEQNEDIF